MVTLVTGLASTYLYHRLYKWSDLPKPIRLIALWILVLAVVLQFVGPGVYRSTDLSVRNPGVQALQWIAYSLMGLICYLLFYSALYDGGGLARAAWTKLKGLRRKADPTSNPAERRAFLATTGQGSLLFAAAASTLAGVVQATQGPEVREVEVPIENLPPSWEGLRIAQISDLHVGPTIDRTYAQRVVEQTLQLKPDLIALTGDFIDGTVNQLREEVAPLGKLNAPHGVFFCTGNHEYFSGVESWIEEFTHLGFKCLGNRHEVVSIRGHDLVVAGVHDYSAQRFNPSHKSSPLQALEGAPQNAALRLLLAHQPKSIYEASDAGVDLQLSGHTHNGQFFPVNFLVHLVQPYVKGLNLHHGKNGKKTWIYVNVGTGYWGPPVRLGVPSEITLLKLKIGHAASSA